MTRYIDYSLPPSDRDDFDEENMESPLVYRPSVSTAKVEEDNQIELEKPIFSFKNAEESVQKELTEIEKIQAVYEKVKNKDLKNLECFDSAYYLSRSNNEGSSKISNKRFQILGEYAAYVFKFYTNLMYKLYCSTTRSYCNAPNYLRECVFEDVDFDSLAQKVSQLEQKLLNTLGEKRNSIKIDQIFEMAPNLYKLRYFASKAWILYIDHKYCNHFKSLIKVNGTQFDFEKDEDAITICGVYNKAKYQYDTYFDDAFTIKGVLYPKFKSVVHMYKDYASHSAYFDILKECDGYNFHTENHFISKLNDKVKKISSKEAIYLYNNYSDMRYVLKTLKRKKQEVDLPGTILAFFFEDKRFENSSKEKDLYEKAEGYYSIINNNLLTSPEDSKRFQDWTKYKQEFKELLIFYKKYYDRSVEENKQLEQRLKEMNVKYD